MEKNLIFIKGKNPELSKFEITSYLDARGHEYNILDDSQDFLIIHLNDVDLEKMMKSLGGTLKIAEKVANVNKNELKSALDSIELGKFFKIKIKKFVFGVSVYSEKDSYKIYRSIGNYFKKRLRQYKISSKFLGFPRKRAPQLTNVEVIKKNLIEESAEIIICSKNDRVYIGVTKTVHNPFEFQKRDIGRPAQRVIFSISPRLSNILINLSGAKEGDLLLDPFCGVGTILQEAVLNGIDIIGLDIDEECVKSSKENLEWLSKEYNLNLGNADSIVKVGDARKLSEYFKENSIDAVATEPYLGPPLKKRPSEEEIKKIFDGIRNLYEDSLGEMYKILKYGKSIAVVSPCIRTTKSKYVKFDFSSIARKAGFKIINSFIDAEERHRTFREIFVIEKT